MGEISVPKKMRTINFKKNGYFIDQYVNLRNSYIELLLTEPVDVSQTREWLKRNDIEIRGLVKDSVLLGVAILYISRDGEIAFFVRYPNKGTGSRLLKIIEETAKEKGLKSIWAWVIEDNFITQQVLTKNGFLNKGLSEREYKNTLKRGIKYIKILNQEIK